MNYLKTFDQALIEMAQSLLADLGIQVDLVMGSSIERSLLEALAFQVNDLSERGTNSIEDAIPTAIFEAFGFAALLPKPAQGILAFGVQVASNADILIPAGTEAATDEDQFFVTTKDVTLRAGEKLVYAPAQAVQGGVAGNVQAFTVNRLVTGVAGLSLVTNPAPFIHGTDSETREQQAVRFLDYLAQMDKSNAVALGLAARQATDGEITARNVMVTDGKTDKAILPGTFQVSMYRRGGVPETLRAAIEAEVDKVRAGGCIPTFVSVDGTPVDVAAKLTVLSAGAVPSALAALGLYFDGLTFGQKVSRNNIITVLKDAHPSILEVQLSAPAGDIYASRYTRFEIGTPSVTETVGSL